MFNVMLNSEFCLSVTVTAMSVVLPLISSSVPSLYHVMLEGGEPRVWQTRVIPLLLESYVSAPMEGVAR